MVNKMRITNEDSCSGGEELVIHCVGGSKKSNIDLVSYGGLNGLFTRLGWIGANGSESSSLASNVEGYDDDTRKEANATNSFSLSHYSFNNIIRYGNIQFVRLVEAHRGGRGGCTLFSFSFFLLLACLSANV